MEFNTNHHKNLKYLIWVLTAFLLILTISGIIGIQNKIKQGKYIGQDVMIRNTFTVSDSAEVYTKPDLGMITFSVKTEARTVAKAMAENTEKMNNIISFLKNSGVDQKDLKTTNFDIYPRYEYDRSSSIYPSGERVLAGYDVSQSLEVKIRELDKAGDLIAGTAERGANQVGNLYFVVENEDEFEAQARAEAIKKARAKAEKIAEDLDVDIVGIVNFSENGQAPRYYDYSLSERGIGGGGGGSPEIETGENKIEVFVSITYEIN